jgi:SAM-dependent methyltransferase
VNPKLEQFYDAYGDFESEVHARIRRKAFGEDFGQNSWTTADEYRRWAGWLELGERSRVLEVASGSGGPALFLARISGARVTGIDLNVLGVAAGAERARALGLEDRVDFAVADANGGLDFPDASFDAILCIDAANHLPDRAGVLKEWHRVLAPDGRALFTDPVVVTGLVSNEEFAARSSIGSFLFAPPGVNERLIAEAGFELERKEDITENAALVSQRRHEARAEERAALVAMEGEARFEGSQQFYATVHRLTRERRLSRFVYVGRK